VRRLARQGILYVDRTPPTPSTSQLHHRLSTSLALPLSAQPSDPQAKQRASSWAALSLAGRSLFAPRDSPPHQSASADSSSVPLPTHEGHAAALITELRLPHPDPHRVWSLFSQLEMAGTTYTLPPISLHSLLKAIHIQPKSRRTLDVHSSTGAARAYAAKVEIVRLRILQSKGTLNRDDFNASLKQQAVFKYAPGVCKAWDELIDEGVTPTVDEVKLAFQTMLDWIEMHEKDGGRTLGRMAARPLVAKIMTMLEDLEGESKQTDVALDYFFQIVLKARNLEVFTLAMKTIYGFDIKLPGADFDVGGTGLRRQMGEAQVCWTLEMLSEMGDMSGMLAVFEVCDSPSPALLDNTYFGHSFHPPPDSTASIHPPPPTTPHLIGTHAHSLIIHAASRMGHGAIARMYMNQLYWRWQISSDARLVNIERAVGITYEKKAPGHDQEVVNVMEGETFESEVVQTGTSIVPFLTASTDNFSSQKRLPSTKEGSFPSPSSTTLSPRPSSTTSSTTPNSTTTPRPRATSVVAPCVSSNSWDSTRTDSKPFSPSSRSPSPPPLPPTTLPSPSDLSKPSNTKSLTPPTIAYNSGRRSIKSR
jgi:hypothetical protein